MATFDALIGLPAETQGGDYLGKVIRVDQDNDLGKLLRVYIKPTLIKRLWCRQFIIDRSQIIKVTPEKIIVDDASIKNPIRDIEKATRTAAVPE